MSISQEQIKDLVAKGHELAGIGLTVASLVGGSTFADKDKNEAVLRIVQGSIDAAGAIASLVANYTSDTVKVPELADLEAQLATLKSFKPLPEA